MTDNLAQGASDYTPFSVTAPLDPRLPNGGGYTIAGLYDVNQNVASSVNNLVTLASNHGSQSQYFNGVTPDSMP